MNATKHKDQEAKTLRDFTRLLIAFFCSLIVLAVYQQLRLYALGVLDHMVGKSLFLLIVHHIGFAALTALPLAFLFNALERKRPTAGLKTTGVILLLLLAIEGLLIEYYVTRFEILGEGFLNIYTARVSFKEFLVSLAILIPISWGSFFISYRISSSSYKIIGRMYPFTIILFTLFLATLYSDKKPVNENKTQHLIVYATTHALDLNKYEGEEEYPLLKEYDPNKDLVPMFELNEEPPNLVIIILDGIGSDFVGEKAAYKGFTPYLDSLTAKSLYWPNHLSNTGESHASLATVLGSLPFGESGFNKAPDRINRNTLLGILKKNGYTTSFNYGGNSALHQWDKFLFEDRIDNFLDIKGFGSSYTLQDEDVAGISLGYPDGEMYRKWIADRSDSRPPFAEVFFTLSTKKPYKIPNEKDYLERVERNLNAYKRNRNAAKIIEKNKDVFASVLYADEALARFMKQYKDRLGYKNTIFVITGSHNLTELPPRNPLARYRVPLIIYSPMVKRSREIKNLVSHADITPSLAGLLHYKYQMKIPEEVSFIGSRLVHNTTIDEAKQIPLYRHAYNIKDFISGSYFLSGNYIQKITADLILVDPEEDAPLSQIESDFRQFKAVNKYVVRQNKLIPEQNTLFAKVAREPSKQEMIWINSVFNGDDFDNAYETARSLAFDGDRERALLLCAYILNRVPGHADTEILMGRIHAWHGQYETAIEILEGAILKYPVYADAYAALLDVYFWSDNNERALLLQRQIDRNKVENDELKFKVERAVRSLLERQQQSSKIEEKEDMDKEKTIAINVSE